MKDKIIRVFCALFLCTMSCSLFAEQITKHIDADGSEDWYWTKKVTVSRGKSHTFWIKGMTENTAISWIEVTGYYTYEEEGETYEDSIWLCESCEVENAIGGFDQYVLLATNDWEFIPDTVTSVAFTIMVYGWEPDEGQTLADLKFTFGHASGDEQYPYLDDESEYDEAEFLEDGGPYTEEVGRTEEIVGVTWTFMVTNGTASIETGDSETAIFPCSTAGDIVIPETLGGCPVTRIGDSAFRGCMLVTSVTVPSGVTSIGRNAFSGCSSLTNAPIPAGVKEIGDMAFADCIGLSNLTLPTSVLSIGRMAFYGCSGLAAVTIPANVTEIGVMAFSGCPNVTSVSVPGCFVMSELFPDSYAKIKSVKVVKGSKVVVDHAFDGCTSLLSATIQSDVMRVGDGAFQDCQKLSKVTFLGNAPDLGSGVFGGTPQSLTITVPDGSTGWSKIGSSDIPESWGGRAIATASGQSGGGSAGSTGNVNATIVVTNVVVHYVLNSVQPSIALPITASTTFVTVITEIKGGNVTVPDSWADNYPSFTEKYGSDFAAALSKPTGKRDAEGNSMLVWQDFVAGTDPTDEKDVFTASITIVDGVPVISYSPELTEEQAALRVYKTFGKGKLTDAAWTDITEKTSEERANYNFFKVTVEMK